MAKGKFPKPTKLSDAINVWRESDIDAWINNHFAPKE
jgi:predicted DNA-binding transcriptional regulator AlpA